jgi:ribosomal protein L31E
MNLKKANTFFKKQKFNKAIKIYKKYISKHISSQLHIQRVRKIVHNLKLDMLYLISYVKA